MPEIVLGAFQSSVYNWFVLRVRSNFERIANTLIFEKGIESFLPTYRVRRTWSDRIREVDCPLFPGYLFCRLKPSHRVTVLSTTGVVGLVGAGRRATPVTPAEIQAVMDLVNSQLPVRPHPFLGIGQSVRIAYGPLAGLEGIVVRVKNRCRFVVSVMLLQRSVAVEIDPAWLRTAN